MSSLGKRCLAASLGLHGILLWGLATAPPWEGPAASAPGGRWSEPVVVAAYDDAGSAGSPAAPPSQAQEPAPREPVPSTLTPSEEPKIPPRPVDSADRPAEAEPVPAETAQEAQTGASTTPSPARDLPGKEGAAADSDPGVAGAGGGPDHPPRFLGFVLPEDREGATEIQVRILVGPRGEVQKVEAVEKGVDPELLNEIRKATQTMRFLPAVKDGKRVAAWLEMGFVL